MKWRFYAWRKKAFVLWISFRHDMNHKRCAYCDCHYTKTGKRQRSIDHVIPLSKGGRNRPSNMVFACVGCNVRKSDQSVEEFLESPWLRLRKATIFAEELAIVV